LDELEGTGARRIEHRGQDTEFERLPDGSHEV